MTYSLVLKDPVDLDKLVATDGSLSVWLIYDDYDYDGQ